jgi:hypothetical protein
MSFGGKKWKNTPEKQKKTKGKVKMVVLVGAPPPCPFNHQATLKIF